MREIFLDTTYVMPFFYMDIDIDGFSRSKYADLIQKIEKVHISEISIFEAKIKSLKLRDAKVLSSFNKGLRILRRDGKVEIHGYTAKHDRLMNNMLGMLGDVNIVDLIIMSQAKEIGVLLTEDRVIHKCGKKVGIRVLDWKSFVKLFS